jgi:outer membrane murein-binding lipoprotein Lpp
MTTLQKTIVAAALAAAVGAGIYTVHRQSQLSARIHTLQKEQSPLLAQIEQLEQERRRAANQVAALREENAQLKAKATSSELLRLRGEVGVLRQRAASNDNTIAQPSIGLAKMMNDPAMKEYMMKAMREKLKTLYADLIVELKLTPEQTEQFMQLISTSASQQLAQLTEPGQRTPGQPQTDAPPEIVGQLEAVLGDTGAARFKEFSAELPARATVTLVNDKLGAPLSPEQSESLLQIIKAEPGNLTQGILGSPDKAFLGSPAEIEDFLYQVQQSNQRILHLAAPRLEPEQLAVLDSVLTKAVEARKLQGAAFFQKR